jgi:hypothetical protein
MLNMREVLARVVKLSGYTNMKDSDYRQVVYCQKFSPASGGALTAMLPQAFPVGAIVIGILGSAAIPGAAPMSGRGRQCFEVDFGFTGGESLTIGGPTLADAILGGGESDIFPCKELVMAPNQQINCRVANVTNGALDVYIAYHCLVYRLQG